MKKFLSIVLTASIILQSLCTVYAGSTNTLLGSPRVMPNSPVYLESGELNALQIQPRNEVESGDSIIISVENGKFDRSFVEDEYVDLDGDGNAESLNPFVFRTNKHGFTYDYIVENQLGSIFDTLKIYIGDEDSRCLPYGFNWLNESEIEVELFPIFDTWVNQNNSDVTQGTPIYNIPLPIISGSNELDDVVVSIDDNGSSITYGRRYIYAKVDSNADDYYESLKHPLTDYNKVSIHEVERCIKVGATSEIKYNNRPIGFMVRPTREVEDNSFVYVVIKNGKFDKSMVDECQFRTNKTRLTYDDVLNCGLDNFDTLKRYIGDENSRFLPYNIEYVDETTLKVKLFPISDTRVNQNNTDVTQGVPVYNILLPAISGSEGITGVAVDGRNADIISGGYYDLAYIDGYINEDYVINGNVYPERDILVEANSKILYNEKPNAIYIKPTKTVESGDSVLIKIKNGTFDESMMDMCKYLTNKNGYDYDYIVNNELASVKDTLIHYLKEESGRFLPYNIEYIDQNTIKANLYPINEDCLNASIVSDGIPVYKILLPAVSGSESTYTQVAVNSNGSTIPNAGYYNIARTTNAPLITTSSQKNTDVSTISRSSKAGKIVGLNDVDYAYLQISSRIGVEEGTSITLTVKNGYFDKGLVEDKEIVIDTYKEKNPFLFYTSKTRFTYDEVVAKGLSVYDTIKSFIGDENSRQLPYKMEYVDRNTVKVNLYPLPDNKAGINNSDITYGSPYYSITLPVIAGENEGDVTVTVDGTNTVIGSYLDAVIAHNFTDSSVTANMSVSMYDIKDITGTTISIPNINVRENYPDAFKEGNVVFTLDNGYVFDTTSSPELVSGANCWFDNLSPIEFTENKIVFELGEDEFFFTDEKHISSYILKNAVVKGISGLDVILKLTGSAIPNTDTSLTVAKGNNSLTEISTELTTEATTEFVTEKTTEFVTDLTSESTTELISESISETTTQASLRPSTGSGGGGGGGGSSVVKSTTTTTTTETTTESTTSQVTTVEETSTEATTVSKEVRVSIGSNDIVIGNDTYSIDAAAYIQSATNSTMVPLRFVSIALLGENVDSADNSNAIKWDADTKTAIITYGDNVISFMAGSNVININGVEKTMANNAVAEITDNRIYIPFRALGEAFGVDVDWDSTSKTAIYKL